MRQRALIELGKGELQAAIGRPATPYVRVRQLESLDGFAATKWTQPNQTYTSAFVIGS
jgi:hypothetical protein